MVNKWKFKHLIDLDYFISLRKNFWSRESDRDFYLNRISPELEKVKLKKYSPNELAFLWLKIKKKDAENKTAPKSPGEVYSHYFSLVFFIFCFIVFIMGFSAAFAFLSYTGKNPVNVAYYWMLFAGINLLVMPLGLIPFFCRKTPDDLIFLFPGFNLFKKALIKTTFFFCNKVYRSIFNKTEHLKVRNDFLDLDKYKDILFWLVFLSFQFGAMLFYSGVLLGTLVKIMGTDLAFGWQTTLNAGPNLIHSIVSFISLPWSWFVPDFLSNPTLQEIIGSKIILKDGIGSLSTENMVSWWPFLCLSVFFYGIVPRFLFLIFSILFYMRTLKNYPKDTSDLRELVRALTKPEIDFSEKSIDSDLENLDKNNQIFLNKNILEMQTNVSGWRPVRLLLPEDIYSSATIWLLKKTAVNKFGHLSEPVLKITGVFDLDEAELKENLIKAIAKSQEIVMLVHEGWQPPLKQTIEYFKRLRQFIGQNSEIIVFLVGKPSAEKGFLKVREKDYLLWNSKIKELKDPLTSIFNPCIE
ncbi:MAG: DUF2868 domain-containing protein [Desulforegulaceae bacterium]|nr:DUF2868 domain-containing protein [Desulforegulaceae bacterium]